MSTILCPHCSTYIEDFATVCPGCGAEKVETKPKGRFGFIRFIFGTVISLIGFFLVLVWTEWHWVFYVGIVLSPIFGLAAAAPSDPEYAWQRE